jgi:uncharacterized protein (DUF1501 family)
MKLVNRRQFLEMGLLAGAGVAAASALPDTALGARKPRVRELRKRIKRVAPVGKRRLVVLDCGGGNDGLSLFPLKGDSASAQTYRALRPRTAIPEASMLPIHGSSVMGMHPSLSRIRTWNPAIVTSVGVAKPDLSHFEMMRRWWSGDQDSVHVSSTGFLGRVCDELGSTSDPAVGVSLGYGPSPALNAAKVTTLSMNPYSDGSWPSFGWDEPRMDEVWRSAWNLMAERPGNETVPFTSARDGCAYAKRFSDLAVDLPSPGGDYPGTDLGYQMMLAARMCRQDNGIRVIHIPVYADFDTHDQHRTRHAEVLDTIDQAVDAFMAEMAATGHADEVLLAMTSEFGRRIPDNESDGLDHGAGSHLLMLGPVNPGFYGETPDLTTLDRDDNLIASLHMNDYYATIAEGWFDIPRAEVIAGGSPIPGIFDLA